MRILRYIDIENAVRSALNAYMTCYCRPLPANFTVPCILVQMVGGDEANTIDTFDVVLDSRAEDEETALLNLRNAIGILKAIAKQQTTSIAFVSVNSIGSWDRDPVRPELALCTARLTVIAHEEESEVSAL